MREPCKVMLVTMILPVVAFAQTSAPASAPSQQLKPGLKWPTLESYKTELGEPGLLLQSDHLWLFAPKRKSTEADVIFKVLVRAYDELQRIVGVDTKYKIC